MHRLIILFLLLAACNSSGRKVSVPEKEEDKREAPLTEAKLNNYFKEHEIIPTIAIENPKGFDTAVQLAGHRIVWLDSEDETRIGIDEDVFTLKDKVTINEVWDGRDSVDFVNNWDQAKLYKINERELIGIRMSYRPCTGIGCNVDYYLVYDVRTKSKSFFGTFRSENNLSLYNFNDDDKVDYLSKTYSGDAHGSTFLEVTYNLYSMEINGYFVQQYSPSRAKYEIMLTKYPNDTLGSKVSLDKWFTK
jgi:hypothetical protein